MSNDLLGMYAVVDVGCPNASRKQQQLKGEKMHGHYKQQQAIWYRLQHHPPPLAHLKM